MSTTKIISLPKKLPKRKVVLQAVATNHAFIKKLIWVYFFLLLFEGALRKWFLRGISQGLLIIRDPIVIWIYYLCYTQGLFPLNNKYLQKCFLWVGLAVVLSLLINQTHPATIFYGARTNLLHFPLIFIMAGCLIQKKILEFQMKNQFGN